MAKIDLDSPADEFAMQITEHVILHNPNVGPVLRDILLAVLENDWVDDPLGKHLRYVIAKQVGLEPLVPVEPRNRVMGTTAQE